MKGFMTRVMALLMSVLLVGGLLTGCGKKASEQSQTKLFSYDGTDVYLDEAWIYAKIAQTGYESSYSTTFGDSMWSMEVSQDSEGNAVTFEQMVKENVIEQMKQVKVLVNKAKELKISLTDEEKEECKKNAKEFAKQDEGKAILEETGGTEETMQKIYEENALASKVQKEFVKDVDTKVSDEEANKTTVYKLVFPLEKTDSTTGEKKAMSEKEKKAQIKKAKEAYKKIEKGTDIEEVAKEYELTDGAEESFTKGNSLGGDDFEKVIYAMKDGEITKLLETKEGYVVAKLVALKDEAATEENIKSIIEQREQELYQQKYDELVKELDEDWDYTKDVDEKAWSQVTFAKASEETTEGASEEGTEASTQADTAAETTTEQ